MELKTAVKVFSAVASYVSTDKTRLALQYVFAPSPNVLVATDGHALIRLILDKPHGFRPVDKDREFSGLYDVKGTVAKLKAGIEPKDIPAIQDDYEFPQFARVIPEFRPSGDAASATLRAINPALLSRCLEAFASISKAFQRTPIPVRIQSIADSHDPTRLDMALAGEFKVTAVVMPMRAEEADYQACAVA